MCKLLKRRLSFVCSWWWRWNFVTFRKGLRDSKWAIFMTILEVKHQNVLTRLFSHGVLSWYFDTKPSILEIMQQIPLPKNKKQNKQFYVNTVAITLFQKRPYLLNQTILFISLAPCKRYLLDSSYLDFIQTRYLFRIKYNK